MPYRWIVTVPPRCPWILFALACMWTGSAAVGCNRQKVSAAGEAVKASLHAAGLQCFDVEADVSRQVFTRLHLNHETGLLSLEASRIWRLWTLLRIKKILTSDQVAKLIGHTTWSCLLRRLALSLINAGYHFA